MMAILRRQGTRRLVASAVWLGIAAGFAHLMISSDRLGGIDPRPVFAAAAGIAVALAVISWRSRGDWTRAVSGVAGALTFLLAALLIVERAAHETGVAIAFLGVLSAAGWILDPGPDLDPT